MTTISHTPVFFFFLRKFSQHFPARMALKGSGRGPISQADAFIVSAFTVIEICFNNLF